ncbi:MAG: hypothetical protein ACXWCY_31150 [Burkholderiales bacterium]
MTGLVHIPPIDSASDVWLFNRIAVPAGSHLPAVLHALPDRERDGYAALWTQAVVILNAPALVDGALNALRGGNTGSLGLGGNLFRALTSLNEVIFGYVEAVGTLFGGSHLHFLTDMEFFNGLRLEFAFVANSPCVVTEADVREVIEWRPEREFRSLGQLTGELSDLPADVLTSIPRHIERLRAHAYQELAFRAKMAMLDRHPMVALVLACAALEGVHADLLRRVLAEPLSPYGKGSDGLIENLLRGQGIYSLLQLTSQVFIDAQRRPPVADVKRCLDALTMRNEIVHAKKKREAYRMRAHTFKDLSDAYQAVFEMYSTFIAVLPGEGNADSNSP